MAHENLKFKLDLNERKEYQPIFGSQDYGTFYMIYVKIKDYKKFTNEHNIEQHTYICDFKLQNYRGQITMGFVVDTFPFIMFPDGSRSTDNEVGAYLNIKVAPFTVKEEIKDIVIELEKPLGPGMILQTEFERLSPPSDIYDPVNPENSRYLNPYRFVRDGEAFSEISARKYGDRNPFPTPNAMGCWIGPCIPDRSIIM